MSPPDSESSVQVCDVDDVAEGEAYVDEIDGNAIAVFLVDGEYFALDNSCPHQGGPLDQGKVEDKCVYCPWHGWQFDLESGDHVQGKKSATTYDVTVEDGGVYVSV